MTTTRTLTRLLIAALLAGATSVYAAETPMQVAMEDGKPTAQFKMGEFRCVLQNDEIRCMPVGK